MRKDCWIQSSNVLKELTEFFSDVDDDFSSYYEEHPTTAEPQLDGILIGSLRSKPFELFAKRINVERARTYLSPISLTIKSTSITEGEREYGADIGLVARLSVSGEYEITKAALVQSKRLHPNLFRSFDDGCSYNELFKQPKTVGPQWERMLGVTPSSFYFLYNPQQLPINRKLKDLKTRVLSAQMVSGMAKRQPPITPKESVHYQAFGQWMVEEFICCHTGDTRDDVIGIALGENRDFSVRHSVEVLLNSEQVQTESFLT